MTEREPRRSRDDTNERETVVFVNEKRKDGRRRNSGEWKEERKKRGKEGRKRRRGSGVDWLEKSCDGNGRRVGGIDRNIYIDDRDRETRLMVSREETWRWRGAF